MFTGKFYERGSFRIPGPVLDKCGVPAEDTVLIQSLSELL